MGMQQMNHEKNTQTKMKYTEKSKQIRVANPPQIECNLNGFCFHLASKFPTS